MKKHAEAEQPQQAKPNQRLRRQLEEITPRLLRLNEAARYMNLSTGSLRRLVQAGQIRVVRISDNGGKNVPWLINRYALDSWIEKNSQVLP